jgi:hypothetical protein
MYYRVLLQMHQRLLCEHIVIKLHNRKLPNPVFWSSPAKRLLTMPHMLQTIRHMFATSCGKFKR